MRSDLLIIGGGITGLSAAYIAAKAGRRVTVLEASPRFGGLLDTFEVGGTRLEKFYHHFFLHDAEMMWLLRELELEEKLTFKETKMGVLRDSTIFGFDTVMDLLRLRPLGLIDKLRFGVTSLYLGRMANWKKTENTSAVDWFRKWSGKHVTKCIWEPLLRAKFGSHYDKVPLAWMIGRLKQRMTSRRSGKEQLGYLEGSLGVLCDALVESLQNMGVVLQSATPVKGLSFEREEFAEVITDNRVYTAEHIISTVPNQVLASLVEKQNPEFAKSLRNVEYFGAVCTVLEMKKPLSDVYWLNVADAGYPFGGVIEQTNFIGPHNYEGKHIAYLSRYFAHEEKMADMETEALEKVMLAGVRKAFPKFSEDDVEKTHVFKIRTAATVCDLGFSQKVEEARSPIDRLSVANMMHIYPDERSVNNSIRVAANVCRTLGIYTSDIPGGNSLSGQIGIA